MSLAEALKREDRRVARQQEEMLRAERKLSPIISAVCSVYQVVPEDIVSPSIHPDVLMARNIVTYLGWSRCKIGPTILAGILCKQRSDTSAKIIKLKKAYAAGDSFTRQVDAVVRRAFPGEA